MLDRDSSSEASFTTESETSEESDGFSRDYERRPATRRRTVRTRASRIVSDESASEGEEDEEEEEEEEEEGERPRKRARRVQGKREREREREREEEEERVSRRNSRIEVRRAKREKRQQKRMQKARKNDYPVEEYLPAEFMTSTEPSIVDPYKPQVGDVVAYFYQLHELYVEKRHGEMDPRSLGYFPWEKFKEGELQPVHFCEVLAVHYHYHHEEYPPALCDVTLGVLRDEFRTAAKFRPDLLRKQAKKWHGRNRDPQLYLHTFTFTYHEVDNQGDIMVLKSRYDEAMQYNWVEGDRIQVCFDGGSWYEGSIVSNTPLQEEVPESPVGRLVVFWDSQGETGERYSSWDVFPLDTPLTDHTVYMNRDTECIPEEERRRLLAGLDRVCEETYAGPFLTPVSHEDEPLYPKMIAYPMDLGTIRGRLENNYYRSVYGLLWDVHQVAGNCQRYNEAESDIVADSRKLEKVLVGFIENPAVTDPTVPRSGRSGGGSFGAGAEILENVDVVGESEEDGIGNGDRPVLQQGRREEEESEEERKSKKKGGVSRHAEERGEFLARVKKIRDEDDKQRIKSALSKESNTMVPSAQLGSMPLAGAIYLNTLIGLLPGTPAVAASQLAQIPGRAHILSLGEIAEKLRSGQYADTRQYIEELRYMLSACDKSVNVVRGVRQIHSLVNGHLNEWVREPSLVIPIVPRTWLHNALSLVHLCVMTAPPASTLAYAMALQLPDSVNSEQEYRSEIDDPEDFGHVFRQLLRGQYLLVNLYVDRVSTIFENARAIPGTTSPYFHQWNPLHSQFLQAVRMAVSVGGGRGPLTGGEPAQSFPDAQVNQVHDAMMRLPGVDDFFNHVVGYEVPDYYTTIETPMDLGTMKTKLRERRYGTLAEYFGDMALVLANCFQFNPSDSDVAKIARRMRDFLLRNIDRLIPNGQNFLVAP